MDSNDTTPTGTELFAGEVWFDPIEAGLRDRIRGFIEEVVEQELAAALGRERYARDAGSKGYRNGTRERQLTGSFGAVAISVPRARLSAASAKARMRAAGSSGIISLPMNLERRIVMLSEHGAHDPAPARLFAILRKVCAFYARLDRLPHQRGADADH